jgi:simple sugar transport system ATP-binding protein
MTLATPLSPSKAPSTRPLLSLRAITKRFPGVVANRQVSLEVYPGEVHALLGENGAGKTTLMNILYGLYQPDEGELYVRGRQVAFHSPRDAARHGIGLVAQHFHLARRHSVAENIGLGLAETPFFFPTRRLAREIAALSKKYQLTVDPHAKVWQLSPGEQQRVEILKALIRKAKILILDEPTSVLTPQESEALFKVLRRMRAEGEAVIFISHKLHEVMAIADRITVLRKGAVAASLLTSEATPAKLAQLMVGRALAHAEGGAALREVVLGEALPDAPSLAAGPPVLSLRGVCAKNRRGLSALRDVSLELYRGEILGVAGVAGNGQGELIEVLTGLRQPTAGQILLDGQDCTRLGARERFEAGVAHIPEDRNHMGIAPSMSVAENLVLRQYRYPPFARGGLLDWRAVRHFADKVIHDYEVATPSQDTVARLLSGGNVQKLILARELSGQPKLVVAAHPTYGLDINATAQTHALLRQQRDRGAGVLLVSEDLDELLKLADRIAVLFSGRLMGILPAHTATEAQLGLLMAGST